MPLLKAIPIVSLDTFKWTLRPQQLFEYIHQYKASLCWLPNFAFHHLIRNYPKNPSWELSSIRAIINCSEPCKSKTFQLFSKATKVPLNKLHVSYALAENVFAVSQTNTLKPANKISVCIKELKKNKIIMNPTGIELISCGEIVSQTQVKIINLENKVLGDDLIGEICIKGNCLFKGYNNEKINSFSKEWYKTGDMGFKHKGELFVTGRADDLIICFGKKLLCS